MEFHERSVGPVTIVDVSGRFDSPDANGRLKEKVSSLLFETRRLIVLNLAGVSYIASTGLGELAATHAMVSRQGGRIVLLNLTKRVENLLALCRLLTVFDVFETEAEAVADLSAVATGV
jgi:anti-sigma B factor antagonist